MLGSIPWAAPKKGLGDSLPIHSLWRILGKNWLNSTAIDNALEVLKAEVDDSRKLSGKFLVRNTAWKTSPAQR